MVFPPDLRLFSFKIKKLVELLVNRPLVLALFRLCGKDKICYPVLRVQFIQTAVVQGFHEHLILWNSQRVHLFQALKAQVPEAVYRYIMVPVGKTLPF